MDELLDRLITKCIVAEQLEMENYRPVTCKELLPILEAFRAVQTKCEQLQQILSTQFPEMLDEAQS